MVPSGDDGARSLEEGLDLCRLAVDAGTGVLFATPHAHAPWDSYPRTPERERAFAQAFPQLHDAAAAWGLDLRRGWEVFPSEVLEHDPERYVLEGTRAVLVEFPGFWLDLPDPLGLTAAACERIEAAGLVPVLAHPERCPAIAEAPHEAARFADRGWLLCLNGPSVTGGHGRAAERAAWRLLDDGVVSLVASDAHRRARPPTLDEAHHAVAGRIGHRAADALFDGSALPWVDAGRGEVEAN